MMNQMGVEFHLKEAETDEDDEKSESGLLTED